MKLNRSRGTSAVTRAGTPKEVAQERTLSVGPIDDVLNQAGDWRER